MVLPIAYKTKNSPEVLARKIVKITNYPNLEHIITKQGYINFRFPTVYYQQFLNETLARKGRNLRSKKKNIRINIEYVSTNPTGYLHLAHFRHAFVGNSLANIYEFCGCEVIREYYINDRGGQVASLVNSVYHFYHQLQNISLPNSNKIEYLGQSSQEVA